MKICKMQILILLIIACTLISGVHASWRYFSLASDLNENVTSGMHAFTYGPFYITEVEIVGGSYTGAIAAKSSETHMTTELTLNESQDSTVTVNVTFYNGTDVNYYYNETQTVSSSNSNITYTVSGIEQKEEVPGNTFKTVTVTFGYSGNNVSQRELESELYFHFVVDKESIGAVAAQDAVARFQDVLNNKVSPDSFQALEEAMNNRGSNASSVSYIGNVAGANDKDSQVIQDLFTNQFLEMDLDGDGKSEPITLMIKRENLDGNTETGDSYTYQSLFGINRTVDGVEMTIYITSEGFDQNKLTVYAATYTLLPGSSEWIQVVPLTKGTATANKYSIGFGGNNSFNTDTWQSTDGKSMDTLTQDAMDALNAGN